MQIVYIYYVYRTITKNHEQNEDRQKPIKHIVSGCAFKHYTSKPFRTNSDQNIIDFFRHLYVSYSLLYSFYVMHEKKPCYRKIKNKIFIYFEKKIFNNRMREKKIEKYERKNRIAFLS